MPQTIDAAILYGEELNAFYTQQGTSLANNRRLLALGVWAANTFVLVASGVRAHPESIFAGAAFGSAVSTLDPIVNPGGPNAWSAAHGRNVCVVAVAWGLNTGAVFNDVRTLRESIDASVYATVLQRYDAYPMRLVGVMREVHARYLRDTTPEIPDLNAAANAIIAERTAREPQANNDGAENSLAESQAEARVAAALDLADTELPKCRPLQSAPAETPPAD